MPSLESCGARFDSVFTILSNDRTFKGVLETPLDREPPAFLWVENRRLLTVKRDCIVQLRDVITSRAGEIYAVGASTYAEYGASILYRTHRLFEMNTQVAWSRQYKTVDPLTGLEKESSTNDLGTVWVAMEYTNREDVGRASHIWQERVVCISASELQEGDRIDNREVIRSNVQLGLTVAELR